MAANQPLTLTDGELLLDPTVYCMMVEALQYVTMTRPDISLAVGLISQYMHKSRTPHLQAVKRIFRYLLGTRHHGLLLHRSSPRTFLAYADD